MDEEVCLLLCMKGSFSWLPQDDVTMDVDMTFAVNGNYCSLKCCLIADDEICCREMLVGWWYRRGTETLVSAPLHKCVGRAFCQR